MNKLCKICNEEYNANGNTKTCSIECRKTLSNNYKIAHKKITIKECIVCEKDFKAIGKTKTCSVLCSKKGINMRINKRYNNDINFKLSDILRSRLNKAIKNNQKAGSAVGDLGCSIEELKKYLENQFQEGMNWNNYGLKGWHIDHIKPLASFDLKKELEFKKACHYTNLQPLWGKDNQSKGARDDWN